MKNIYKALAKFQQEVPVIHKGVQGYGYTYADLPAIFGIINPLLKSNGLGFTQLMEGETIKTILFHSESSEFLESVTQIPQNVSLAKMNEFQVLGSAITYIRRYALSSMLGLVTDKDTDASGEQVANKSTVKELAWLNEKDKAFSGALLKKTPLLALRKYFKISKEVAAKYESLLK
jgi:hypothetical protein